MDERQRGWRPTSREVDEILRELRPIINEFARRDHDAIAAELARRRDHGSPPR